MQVAHTGHRNIWPSTGQLHQTEQNNKQSPRPAQNNRDKINVFVFNAKFTHTHRLVHIYNLQIKNFNLALAGK